MNTAIKAHIALQLLADYITAHDDAEAKELFNALVLRLQALEAAAQQQATTTIDEHGNITIGLKPLGMAATVIPAR